MEELIDDIEAALDELELHYGDQLLYDRSVFANFRIELESCREQIEQEDIESYE